MTFDEWFLKSADAVSEARGVSVEDLADEPGALSTQLARARQAFVKLIPIKTDSSSWVLKTRAAAMQESRKKYADYSVEERRAMAESDDSYIKALAIRDEAAATMTALKGMSFEIMNDRRTAFNPSAHH